MQSAFAFPQSLTEKYRPLNIGEFVGLDKIKRAMARLASNPYPSAWLFTGPAGVGKTTMALAVAREMKAELHHIPAAQCDLSTIERLRATCQYVPLSGCSMHLILIDEIDRATMAAQIALLSKLDATDFPPNTVIIGTCNTTENLEPRFLSRFRVLEFSSYGIAKDAADLLERVWDSETGMPADRVKIARLVKNANNNIRAALMALETEIMCA